jgi:hypothetical protein
MLIAVSWDLVSGAEGYEVWYGETLNVGKAGKWEGENTLSGRSASTLITGLTNDERWYVWVRAYNSIGHSEYSDWKYTKPLAPAYTMPPLFFDYGKRFFPSEPRVTGTYTVPSGRALVLAPVEWRLDSDSYEWAVDGAIQAAETGKTFSFSPAAQGTYTVTVKAKKGEEYIPGAEAETSVQCTGWAPLRPFVEGVGLPVSSPLALAQAPGQFVPAAPSPELTGASELAADYATRPGYGYSLGRFGGYVIFGFDHSVENKAGEDLRINGNAFTGWSEPGTVWVSQDDNGNGEPDDTWYELRGSLFGTHYETRRYAVTYVRPAGILSYITLSRDNLGNNKSLTHSAYGTSGFPGYYTSDVTFVGTLLEIDYTDPTLAGYVDAATNKFDISNAVQADGTPVTLAYIDFVKVQCAVAQDAAQFGEISTETTLAYDLHIPDPALLVQGGTPINGSYTYRFYNNSGYSLTVSIGGQSQAINAGADYIFTLNVSSAYMDFSGGNVTFTKGTGTVTFTNG